MEIISIYCFIAFILGAVFMLTIHCIVAMGKVKEPMNNVHFYVARDMNDTLCLYMGKPLRGTYAFYSSLYKGVTLLACGKELKWCHLNENDYKDLKWEDEPVEVFLNMDD